MACWVRWNATAEPMSSSYGVRGGIPLVRHVHRDRAVASRARARLGMPFAAPDEYADVIERLAAEQTVGSKEQSALDMERPTSSSGPTLAGQPHDVSVSPQPAEGRSV